MLIDFQYGGLISVWRDYHAMLHWLSAPLLTPSELLSQDLQATTEDEQDYEAPVEGNLFYKLYSLQDLLLMVRSSVSLTHTRKVGSRKNQV